MKINKILFTITLTLLAFSAQLTAQNQFSGIVRDAEDNDPLIGASVFIKELSKGTITDINGDFALDVSSGNYTIEVSYIGYNSIVVQIALSKTSIVKNFNLSPSAEKLGEVVVTAKGKIQQTREQPFQVSVLDAKPLQVQSQPVTGLVNQISGVRVREEGGMGSNANIMLNGIGGKGIRIFVDGVPADLLGSGMAINNLPINMIDHIEVYKGVIPAHFGSDALGGVLNLVTRDQKRNYIDVSTGVGSFGTYQASLNSRKYWGKGKKYYTGLSGFYNHSDNNYWMDDVDILEDKLGNVRKGSVRRFNDAYTSYMGRFTTGGRNLHWADDMQLNLSVSRTHKEWQHGITAEKAWGEVFSENKDYNIELRWKKRRMLNEKLNASLVSGYNYSDRYSEDIAKKTYYWGTDNNLPNYIYKNVGSETMFWGEGRTPRIYAHNVFARANISYILFPKHTLNLTSLITNESFSGHDERGTLTFGTDPLENPQELLKNYIGLSLESKLFNKRLTNILSAKHFYGKFNVVIIDDDLTNKGYNNESFDDFGYGNALKYQIIPKLSATLNYEYTMRMPDREELFGDFINTFPNSNLTPERSHNIDIGLRFNMAKKLTAEVNTFYRQTSDMIFLNVLNIYKTIYMNLLSTDIKGIEGEIRYNPTQTVSFYANATWQDIRLRGTDDNSKIDPRYIGSRLPNEPRIFGNAGASFTLPFNFFKQDKIQVYYTFNYVHEFYLTWEEEGLEATKERTPTQAVHNGGISYSLDEDKWSLSFESRNFTNEKVYDNFSVQKPGRSFHLKLRMFLE